MAGGTTFFDLRNRLLASASFRRAAERIPVFQWVARKRASQLFALASGFIHSQVLAACLRLDLFERLRHGAVPTDELASATGLPAGRLRHLLRAAAALNLLDGRGDDRFGLGVLGAAMVDNPGLHSLIAHHEVLYRDLADPLAVYEEGGKSRHMQALWPYATAGDPGALADDAIASYTELMASSQVMIAEQVLGACNLAGRRRLMDIGGGSGAFARAVNELWPDLEITVVDLPAVAELARASLAAAGLGDAIRVVGADAIREPLPDGFDVVSLIRILHDHDDDVVRSLLKAARRSLAPGGLLLVGEPLADAPGAGPLIDAYFNVYLLAMGSGRPRRHDELAAMLRDAGFTGIRRHRTRIPLITSVITARPDS